MVTGGFVVVKRDMNGNICGKVYFDRDMFWTKTEYFGGEDFSCASLIFKPAEITDAVEQFSYDPKKKTYSTKLLFPVPYSHMSAEQSVMNARHGEELLLLASASGEFSYCPEKEKEDRLKSMDEIASGTIMMTPAWEIKDGEIPEPAINSAEEEDIPEFTDLETLAEAPEENEAAESDEESAEEKPEISEGSEGIPEETSEENSNDKSEEKEVPLAPSDLVLTVDNSAMEENADITIISGGEKYDYTGRMINGKREGRGRTQQENGLTAYDGEYSENLRDGFGSSYYKNGDLSYVGEWKQDRKNGMGVSFREKDHAINISKWENGKPGEFTSIFDPEGNLRFSGRIIEGKKQGASVSLRLEDGNIFVGKWKDGVESGEGSLFDKDGNLVYTGGWKDGKRHGHGTEFDSAGNIVYSGEWDNDKYLNGILYRKIEP